MRIILKILAVLLICVGLLVAVILFLPDQQYQKIAQSITQRITDRTISIGELKTTRTMNPSIELKDFSIANAQWAKNPQMIQAKSLYLSIDLNQLIKGKLHINDLSASELKVDLVKNKNGQANWNLTQAKLDEPKQFNVDGLANLDLTTMELIDSKIDYRDDIKRLQYRLELPLVGLLPNDSSDNQLINAEGVFNELPFSIKGEAGLMTSLSLNNSLPFNLETVLNESKVNLKGEITEQQDGFYLDTNVVAQTKSLSDLSAFSTNNLPSIGPINISADINGNLKTLAEQGMDVSNLDVKVTDPSIKLDMNGSLAGIAASNQGDVSIDLDVTDLSKLLDLFGLKKEVPGTLKLKANAKGSGKNFGLDVDQAVLDSDYLKAQFSGNIKDILKGDGASIEIKAQAPNLDFITVLFGQKMPQTWGPVSANATLTGVNGQYSLTDIDAEMSGDSKLKASGEIKQLVGFNNMDLDVEASLSSLKEISTFTPSPLPDIGPMNATGKITWHDGKLALNEAQASYQGQYGNAEVTGSIGDLIKFDIVRLKADATIPNLDVAKAFSGVDMPQVGEISASADLISPTALDLSAKNLNARYAVDGIKVDVSGAINSMIKKRADLNLNVSASIQSLASLNPHLNTQFPVIGPITADAKLMGATRNIELNDIKALFSDSALYGSVQGDLGKVFNFKGIDLYADLSTPSIQQLYSRIDLVSDVKKPANLTSHVKYHEGAFHFEESELDIAGNKVIGDLSLLNYLDNTLRPKLTGQINVLNFDVPDVTGRKGNETQKPKGARQVSDDLLPFEFIEKNDLDIKFNIGHLRGDLFDFSNSSVTVRSTDGIFKLGPFEGKLGGGEAVIQLDTNVNVSPPATSFHASVQGFDMAQAGVFRDSEMIKGSGDAYLFFALNSEGKSLAAILANADGGGSLYFEDLLLKKGTLGLFSSDVMRQTLDAINPFSKKQKDTDIECSAFAFLIKDGLLTTPYGIAAEATDYSLTGKGQVNFKNEDINLEFTTKPKKGLGLGFGKLAGLVQVKGTLGLPLVTFNPKGIFQIGATVGAAIATGGLSLLAQGQLEKLQAKSESCARALGKSG